MATELLFQSLTSLISESMRSKIFDGTYRPGTKLNINELAREFNASPVPVREALRNLESDYLVEFLPNRGVMVRELTPEQVRELFLIRVPLEEAAAAEAARRWGHSEDLRDLERLVREMDKAPDSDSWGVLHDEFHRKLYLLSGFPRIVQLAGMLRGQMRPYTKLYASSPTHMSLAQEEHKLMLACMRSRDEAGIRKIVQRHLARPVEVICHAMQAPALPEYSGTSA
jgi:DNA-binding GntR family transcriptional regulator